jgi:hypothetical protein
VVSQALVIRPCHFPFQLARERLAKMQRKIEGHKDAVLCCQALPSKVLISGGEVCACYVYCWAFSRHLSSGPICTTVSTKMLLALTRHACLALVMQDAQLCFTDLNTLSNVGKIRQNYGDAVTSVGSSPASEHLVYASAGQAVLAVDLRKVTAAHH